ncbi:hypothetical protein BV20DRAFT_966206 [Pilatotrama ljubarskyi]|nr:hypothetical protein BV20DRAFT_966206 [Pilatotrama ljubarskyi]
MQRKDSFALWLAIRPLHGAELDSDSDPNQGSILSHAGVSFGAFNEWPCEEFPNFSASIALTSTVPYHACWAVTLQSLSFLGPPIPEIVDGLPLICKLEISAMYDGAGLPVILDTGASVSRLPRRILTPIRHHVVGDLPLNRSGIGLEPGHPPLKISKEFQARAVTILYEFRGCDGKPVTVHAPSRPFLSAINPRGKEQEEEGLIFLQDAHKDDHAVFGLNWFQTMYVSLHKSKQKAASDFVRLAPQWHSERSLYTLPPEFLVPP